MFEEKREVTNYSSSLKEEITVWELQIQLIVNKGEIVKRSVYKEEKEEGEQQLKPPQDPRSGHLGVVLELVFRK